MSEEPMLKKPRLDSAAAAVLKGDVEILSKILSDANRCGEPNELLGAVGEGKEQEGWNVLHLAVMNNQVPCIRVLLEKCPRLAITPTGREQLTPLVLAVKKEREISTIQALIKGCGRAAINFEQGHEFFRTNALWEAFKVKRTEGKYPYHLVKLLIDHGATYTKDLRGAIIGGHVDVVRLMMQHGCKATTLIGQSCSNEFPLYMAAKNGNLPILQLLLKHAPSMVKTRTSEGETVLMAAAEGGHVACVKALIEAGANPTAQDNDGTCVLYKAAVRGKHEVVKILMKIKSVRATAAKMRDWQSECHPLFAAVDSGSAATVRLLANSKFYRNDLTTDNEEFMSAELIDEFCVDWGYLGMLTWTINRFQVEVEEVVYALLDAGFPVNVDNPPLTIAVIQISHDEEKATRIVCRLLEEGASLSYVSSVDTGDIKKPEAACDAFVVAIQVESKIALKLLLQYWGRTPAELLVMYDKHPDVTPLKLHAWAPFLLQYGIPHGQPFVIELEKKLQTAKAEGPKKKTMKHGEEEPDEPQINFDALYSGFLDELRVPSSLKQLARFVIREEYAKKAATMKKTLPTTLKNLLHNLPKEVMSYLLMEVP